MKPDIKISIHDRYQLEIKIVCPLNKKSRVNDYYVDTFFFLPRNLSVNPQNYTRREFYNDFSEYIRFQTPSYTLEKLSKPDNPLLHKLSSVLRHLPKKSDDFTRQLKMFCSIVRSALRNRTEYLLQLAPEKQKAAINDYLDRSRSVFKKFRELRKSLISHPEQLELYDLVDEFLSITINGYLHRLWHGLNHREELGETISAIAKRSMQELNYRKSKSCPSVPGPNQDNSELLYRESTLKKAMADVLYLNVETRKDGVIVENLLLGGAAAVAMIFVTGISFIWKGMFLEEFSLSFFVVWVVAYMFKDRIKSQLQLWCLNRRSHYAYDYRQKIYDSFGNEIGVCREGFRHCDGRDLNQQITQVRNRTTLSRLENGSLHENVIVYRKKLEFFGRKNSVVKSLKNHFFHKPERNIFQEFDVNGVVNIYRINIHRWLYKMDNPKRIVYYSDGKTIHPIKAQRNYHVNIVLRYGEKGGKEQYIRQRIILCRNGIRALVPGGVPSSLKSPFIKEI